MLLCDNYIKQVIPYNITKNSMQCPTLQFEAGWSGKKIHVTALK